MAAIYVAAFKEVDASEQWSPEAAADLVLFFLRTQPDLAFVAESQKQVIGCICGLAKPWWDGHHLVQSEIFIAPTTQRKGVGAALLRHFLAEAKKRYNVTQMESITFKNLDFPSSWYVKLGFQDKNDWKVVIGEVDILTKRLTLGK